LHAAKFQVEEQASCGVGYKGFVQNKEIKDYDIPMEIIMKTLHYCLLAFCLLLACAGFVHAQNTHYPAGVEGIKGASLPPPGLYIRDYNYTYWSNEFKDVGPKPFDLVANVQAPRLVYITKKLFFGGYYGADVIVPLVYQDVTVGNLSVSKFEVGDIFIEPATLSWHLKKADFSLGWGMWIPSGEYNLSAPNKNSIGKGYWTNMFTGGVTYYPDKNRSWSISALNRYEIHYERNDYQLTPGQVWTLEWGLAKSLSKTVDLGFAGYAQLQATEPRTMNDPTAKERAVGMGPELTFVIPKLGVSTSVRYLKEVGVQQRPQGNIFNVTFTKLIAAPSKR
jgi:hypothetical protein